MDGLRHEVRPHFQVVSLPVTVEPFELRLLRGDQQFEHEQSSTLRPVQIVREAFQPRHLPAVEFPVALRVIPHQHLAERGIEGLDVLGEAVAVFEIELILPALLSGTSAEISSGRRVAQNRGPELLIHQDSCLIFGHARVNGL